MRMCVLGLILLALNSQQCLSQVSTTTNWVPNAELAAQEHTITDIGDMQGVSFHDGRVYLYGDVSDANPRVGVLREFTERYEPTGRVVWLRKNGQPLIRHPTGLTWHEHWGTFLGDTVDQKANIYRIDWLQAWADGNLDRAVLDVIVDDAAINGCRPEFVTLHGKDYLATADYGDVHPEIRLYAPEHLLSARRTSAPGVLEHRILCGAFNQNLHWDTRRGELTCVQNVTAGHGWRLSVVNLANAAADGRAWGPGANVQELVFAATDELEGYRPLPDHSGLFVTSSRSGNLLAGTIKTRNPE